MTAMELSKLSDPTATVDQLKQVVNQFVSERSWERFHSPKNLSMSIAIEAAELMEHFQWTDPEAPSISMSNDSEVAQEIADVLAYTLRLSHVLGIDLSAALQLKMERNREKYPLGKNYEPKGSASPGKA